MSGVEELVRVRLREIAEQRFVETCEDDGRPAELTDPAMAARVAALLMGGEGRG